MTSRQEKLIENYVRQKVKKMLKEDYYRISKFKVDINALIDKALESNDSDEVIQVLKYILSHRFNQ